MTAFLQCTQCSQHFELNTWQFECRSCHGLLDVSYVFEPIDPKSLKLDFLNRRLSPAIQDQSGVWRFRELLPFLDDLSKIISLREGNTPLWEVPTLAKKIGLSRLFVKHQGLNPTGSFKDNGMTTAITQAVLMRAKTVLCASTGNTSASMAAYAGRAGLSAVVLIPDKQVALGKLAQAIDYGAKVVQIAGDFDAAMDLVRQVAVDERAYLLNSINPFRIEGQKSIMIELMEQRGWRAPHRIFLPGGNLGNCSAFGKALREMYDLGMISTMPKLMVVQATGASPFANLVRSHAKSLVPVEASTLATAIRIGNPVSWRKALRALEWTQGEVVIVSEEEIADARALLAKEGIGCEPASASAMAGIIQLIKERKVSADEEIVAILTGHQLKDPEYIISYHERTLSLNGAAIQSCHANQVMRIPANANSLRELLSAD